MKREKVILKKEKLSVNDLRPEKISHGDRQVEESPLKDSY